MMARLQDPSLQLTLSNSTNFPPLLQLRHPTQSTHIDCHSSSPTTLSFFQCRDTYPLLDDLDHLQNLQLRHHFQSEDGRLSSAVIATKISFSANLRRSIHKAVRQNSGRRPRELGRWQSGCIAPSQHCYNGSDHGLHTNV